MRRTIIDQKIVVGFAKGWMYNTQGTTLLNGKDTLESCSTSVTMPLWIGMDVTKNSMFVAYLSFCCTMHSTLHLNP